MSVKRKCILVIIEMFVLSGGSRYKFSVGNSRREVGRREADDVWFCFFVYFIFFVIDEILIFFISSWREFLFKKRFGVSLVV